MAEEYLLYLLTGAIFGAIIAIVYQMKIMLKMDKKVISMEEKMIALLEKRNKKSK